MMRIAALALLSMATAMAQHPNRDLGLPPSKPVKVDFSKMQELVNNLPHIHPFFMECKGKTDKVYARQGAVYYACLHGKDVSSEDKGVTIPYRLVERFQEDMRQHDLRMAETRAKVSKAVEDAKAFPERTRRPAPMGTPAMTVSKVSDADLANGPARPPVADEDLQAVPLGTTRDEVLQKLGDPLMKITGDGETYTYLLTSGNSAQLQLDAGKLTSVQLVRMK